MEIPSDLFYTKEHEWIRVEDNKGTVGITSFAQEQLGDVVFVEFPEEGTQLKQGTPFGVVESVKTVSDLYAPVDGSVCSVNKDLEVNPELVNSDPYGKGWMVKFDITSEEQLKTLLSNREYSNLIQEEI